MPCGCGRTAWSWARCAAPRSATCSSAMNTGHEGGAGTLHANSAREVPARLEALAGDGRPVPRRAAQPVRRRGPGRPAHAPAPLRGPRPGRRRRAGPGRWRGRGRSRVDAHRWLGRRAVGARRRPRRAGGAGPVVGVTSPATGAAHRGPCRRSGGAGPMVRPALAVACLALALAVVTFPGRRRRAVGAVQRRPAVPHGARVLPVAAWWSAGALAGLLALGPAGALAGGVAVSRVAAPARAARGRRAAATATARRAGGGARPHRRGAARRRPSGRGAAAEPPTDGPLARAVLAPAAAAAALGDGVPAALAAEAARHPERRPRPGSRRPDVGARRPARCPRRGPAGRRARRHPVAARLRRAGSAPQLAGPRATAAVLTALPVLGHRAGRAGGRRAARGAAVGRAGPAARVVRCRAGRSRCGVGPSASCRRRCRDDTGAARRTSDEPRPASALPAASRPAA